MLQAPVLPGPAFDLFTFEQDGGATHEADVGGRQMVEALMVAAMIAVADKGGDLLFEIAWRIMVLQQDAVLEGVTPALNFALRLRVIRRAAHVAHGPGRRFIDPKLYSSGGVRFAPIEPHVACRIPAQFHHVRMIPFSVAFQCGNTTSMAVLMRRNRDRLEILRAQVLRRIVDAQAPHRAVEGAQVVARPPF